MTLRIHSIGGRQVEQRGAHIDSASLTVVQGKKFFVIVSGMMQVTNSTIGSSLPSGAMDFIADDFNITTSEQLVLPISLFLVGYVIGPLICGPMSEQYGRKWPLTIGYIMFLIFTMACALAPSLPALLVFRLFSGMAAAAPISIITGTYADVHDDPTKRGRAMAWFMAVSPKSFFDSDLFTNREVHHTWSHIFPVHVRFCSNSQLALGILAGFDHCRGILSVHHILSRNVRPSSSP